MHHRKPTRAETPIERIYRVKLAAKCRHPSSASCSASERLNASPVRCTLVNIRNQVMNAEFRRLPQALP